MVVRFVCVIRVPVCARVSRVCPGSPRAPGAPVSFYRYRYRFVDSIAWANGSKEPYPPGRWNYSMLMKDEWSDDEFDDDAEAVTKEPSMIPTPQVISSGGSSSGAADTQDRAAAYNERMARARQASKKTGSAGAHV